MSDQHSANLHHNPVDVVRGFYAALGRGDVPAVIALLDDQVQWTEAERFPYYSGTWVGPQAVVDNLLKRLAADWDNFTAIADDFIVQDTRVVSLGTYAGTYKKTGKHMSSDFAHLWTVKGDKITSFLMYTDTAMVLEALHAPASNIAATQSKFAEADGVRVFYREAGDPSLPTLLLLHGFPSSSHQFRQLIPLLSEHFHVVAPDLPGFGFTEVPAERGYVYTFDALAKTLADFVDVVGLKSYAMYVFDYGAPTGLRLAVKHPERVTGLISQNGNAYLEGLGDAWAPIRAYWAEPSPANRQVIADAILHLAGTKWQYEHGVSDPTAIAPESYTLDAMLLERPGNKEIQLDLFLDYANNLKLYPDFQAFLRATKIPTLAIWGKHDPFFIPPGAEAFKKDNPNAIVELLDTGHFALETHAQHIASRIIEVLAGDS